MAHLPPQVRARLSKAHIQCHLARVRYTSRLPKTSEEALAIYYTKIKFNFDLLASSLSRSSDCRQCTCIVNITLKNSPACDENHEWALAAAGPSAETSLQRPVSRAVGLRRLV